LYVKTLSENEKIELKQRFNRIKELQEQGICFGCYNFKTGEIFPDEGLIFYEDDKVRCQFEKYPRATGQTVIVSKEHYEDVSEMPLELGTHILKISKTCEHYKLEIYEALGLVEFSIEPHLDKDNITDELLVLSEKYLLYGICDNGAIICTEDNISYIGDVFLIDNRHKGK